MTKSIFFRQARKMVILIVRISEMKAFFTIASDKMDKSKKKTINIPQFQACTFFGESYRFYTNSAYICFCRIEMQRGARSRLLISDLRS